MTKQDDILNYVITIKEDVSAIKQHLKELNGKVFKNVSDIERNRCELESLGIKIAKWGGAIAVIIFLLQIGIRYYQ